MSNSEKSSIAVQVGRFVAVSTVAGLLLAGPAAQAQTLQKSFLTETQLIDSGGASGSFCVEFPASSGMFFVAVSFTGSDTFVSTTSCDPSTFVSSIGGSGSGLASDIANTADFLLNGFQNFENVFGAVQAHLDKSVTPEDRSDIDFPDIPPEDLTPVEQNPSSTGPSPETAKKIEALKKEIADLKAELDELYDQYYGRIKRIDELAANGNSDEITRINNLRSRIKEIKSERGNNDPEAEQLAKELEKQETLVEAEIYYQNQGIDSDQLDIDDLEDKISKKQNELQTLSESSDSSAFLQQHRGIKSSNSHAALAYQSSTTGHPTQALTPILSKTSTQGFLLDLDALLRRDQSTSTQRSPWDFWLQGSLSIFDDDQTADRDGQFLQFIGGTSYRINPRLKVGGLVTYNNGSTTSNALASSLSSNFLGAGLFARANVHEGVLLDAVINYQHGWNEITISGASGDFGSDSVNIAAGLSKRFHFHPGWWFEPNTGISYSNIRRSAYTDSTGTAVPGSNVEQGRFTFGPKVGHVFSLASGPLTQGEVFVGLNGIVDFISNGDSSVGNGVVASYPGSGVQLSGGLNMSFDNGWNASASGSYMSVGTLDSYTASISLRIPLN